METKEDKDSTRSCFSYFVGALAIALGISLTQSNNPETAATNSSGISSFVGFCDGSNPLVCGCASFNLADYRGTINKTSSVIRIVYSGIVQTMMMG